MEATRDKCCQPKRCRRFVAGDCLKISCRGNRHDVVDDLPAHIDEQDAAKGITDTEKDTSKNEDGCVDQEDQPSHAHSPPPVEPDGQDVQTTGRASRLEYQRPPQSTDSTGEHGRQHRAGKNNGGNLDRVSQCGEE